MLYAERTIVFENCPDNSSGSEMGAMECHAGDTHHHFDIRFYNMIFFDTSTENNDVDETLIAIPVLTYNNHAYNGSRLCRHYLSFKSWITFFPFDLLNPYLKQILELYSCRGMPNFI